MSSFHYSIKSRLLKILSNEIQDILPMLQEPANGFYSEFIHRGKKGPSDSTVRKPTFVAEHQLVILAHTKYKTPAPVSS